jgi:hypothetical protein
MADQLSREGIGRSAVGATHQDDEAEEGESRGGGFEDTR